MTCRIRQIDACTVLYVTVCNTDAVSSLAEVGQGVIHGDTTSSCVGCDCIVPNLDDDFFADFTAMSIGDGNDDREGRDEVLDDWSCTGSCNAAQSATSSENNALCASNPRVGEAFTGNIVCIEDGDFELEHAFHTEEEITLGDKVKRRDNREVVAYFLLHRDKVVAWLLVSNLAFHNQFCFDGVGSNIELNHRTSVSLIERLWPCSEFGVVVGWFNTLETGVYSLGDDFACVEVGNGEGNVPVVQFGYRRATVLNSSIDVRCADREVAWLTCSDSKGRDTCSVVVVSLVDSQHRDANVVECAECSSNLISVVVRDVIFIKRLFAEVGINLCRRRRISFFIRRVEFDCVDTGLELTVERVASNRNIDAVCSFSVARVWCYGASVGPYTVADVVRHDCANLSYVVGRVCLVLVNKDKLVGSNVNRVNQGTECSGLEVGNVLSGSGRNIA